MIYGSRKTTLHFPFQVFLFGGSPDERKFYSPTYNRVLVSPLMPPGTERGGSGSGNAYGSNHQEERKNETQSDSK
jgi:hypothetical protein